MKRRTYLLLFVLLLHSLLWLRPSPAYACSCVPPQPPADAFTQSGAVFTGRVTNVSTPIQIPFITSLLSRLLPRLFTYDALYGRTVSLAVTDSWKGVNTTQIVVVTGQGGGDCGYDFVVGDEYLVYARHNSRNWATNICTRTTPSVASSTADDFTFLATQPTLPLTTPFPWTTALCRLSLFILIVLVGLAFRARRKRKGESSS